MGKILYGRDGALILKKGLKIMINVLLIKTGEAFEQFKVINPDTLGQKSISSSDGKATGQLGWMGVCRGSKCGGAGAGKGQEVEDFLFPVEIFQDLISDLQLTFLLVVSYLYLEMSIKLCSPCTTNLPMSL